jgi:hypothetical protein
VTDGQLGHCTATVKAPAARMNLGACEVLEERPMRSIVHCELGDPAQVLRLEQTPVPALGPKQVLVRTSCAPIHPGDLLGVKDRPQPELRPQSDQTAECRDSKERAW